MNLNTSRLTGLVWVLLAVCSACAKQAHSPPAVNASAAPSATAAQASDTVAATPLDVSSPESFTTSVLRLLQNADPDGGWSKKEALTLTNRSGLVANLDRIWGGCEARPDACDSEVATFVAGVRDVVQRGTAKATKDQLVALVRDQAYVDAMPADARKALVLDPLVADLVVLYAVDLGTSVRGAQQHDLADAGISRRNLAAVSQQNVAARLEGTGAVECEGPGVQILAHENYLESSRLLLTKTWADLAASSKGSVVVAVPTAELVVFACNPDAVVLAKVEQAADHFWRASDRPISRTLLKWSPQGWRELRH